MASVGVGVARTPATTSAAAVELNPQPQFTNSMPPSNAAVDEAWSRVRDLVDGFPTSFAALEATATAVPGVAKEVDSSSSKSGSSSVLPTLAKNVAVLRAGGLLDVLRAYVLSVLDKKVRDEVAPRYWALLGSDPRSSINNCSASSSIPSRGQDKHQQASPAIDATDGAGSVKAEGTEGESEGKGKGVPFASRRGSYGRVKRALLYVLGEVNTHLTLVRFIDDAAAYGSSGSGVRKTGSNPSSSSVASTLDGSPFSSTHSIEARYRCAFTAVRATAV